MSTPRYAYLMTDKGIAIAVNVAQVNYVLYEKGLSPGRYNRYGDSHDSSRITIGYQGTEKIFYYIDQVRALNDYKEFLKVVSGLDVGINEEERDRGQKAIELIDAEIEAIEE